MTKEYKTKTVNMRTGKRKIARLIEQGWELMPGYVGSVYSRKAVLRKLNPKHAAKRGGERA